MSYSHAALEAGLSTFGALLEAEYGQAINHWIDLPEWGDREKLQVSRALEILILEPIADSAPAGGGDIGAKRIWVLSDHKIAGADFESAWQWRLLAAIDNAAKCDAGQMMTPSDPRMFILKLRYEPDLFAALWERFAAFLCGRALLPQIKADCSKSPGALSPEDLARHAGALQQIPGLETASPAFIAGMVFIFARLGTKSFCDWALELC